MLEETNLDTIQATLEQLVASGEADVHTVRQAGLGLLNGRVQSHPLVVYHPKYETAMRFLLDQEEVVWVPVPSAWLTNVNPA